MKTRRLLSILLALMLALVAVPTGWAATSAPGAKKAASKLLYEGGTQLTLSGKLKITRRAQAPGGYEARLALDEPADFVDVWGDDGYVQDFLGLTELLVEVPNRNHGKKVRVTGTLVALRDAFGFRVCGLQNATQVLIPPVRSIKLNKKSASVILGETLQLEPTVLPASASQKVTWSVDKSSVIRVNKDGLVTTLMGGTANVTAKAGNGRSVKCKVVVRVPLLGIGLSATQMKLKKGASMTLKPSFTPADASNKKLKWTSADKKIATVSQKGVVKAIAAGVVNVTCVSNDGAFEASCLVEIAQSNVPVTGIVLSISELELQQTEQQKISAAVEPQNATDPSVRWSSSDPSVATVSGSGMVTGISDGTATITARNSDGSVSADCRVGVQMRPEPPEVMNLIGVAVTPGQFQLRNGGTRQLDWAPIPAGADLKQVTWTSLDPATASIDPNGLVTAKKRGIVILVADSGEKDEAGDAIIGTAVLVINTADYPAFVSRGASDIAISRDGQMISFPLDYSEVDTKMPDGTREQVHNAETGKTEMQISYEDDDSVLIYTMEAGNYVFSRFELGDISVRTARGLVVLNAATKMLEMYGMPDRFVALPDEESVVCDYFVDVEGIRYAVSFAIDYQQNPQNIISCSIVSMDG